MAANRKKSGSRYTPPAKARSRPSPKPSTSAPPAAAAAPLPPALAWLVKPTFLFISLAGCLGLLVGAVLGGSASGAAVWGLLFLLNAAMLYVSVRRQRATR
ncbi:MAG TPA: hypothetical protein VGH94_13450 [Acidimicrobiales bacterium]